MDPQELEAVWQDHQAAVHSTGMGLFGVDLNSLGSVVDGAQQAQRSFCQAYPDIRMLALNMASIAGMVGKADLARETRAFFAMLDAKFIPLACPKPGAPSQK